ncbi:MAG: methyltransferase domain-containing protein, partial [Candidatus Margulisbacteria bacterium]|nr:methyltransferase domain-containing protein [Candidatus Margulisiibacteriota bacterium]
MNKEMVRANFSRGASLYDDQAFLQKELSDQLLAMLVDCSPTRILDLGCGTGYLTGLLAERYPLALVVGIDIAPGMIDAARERSHPNIRYVVADAENYTEGRYDLIVANAALQWMDLSLIFSNVLKLLLPGGRFVFSTFGPRSLGELKACGFRVNEFPSLEAIAAQLVPFSRKQLQDELIGQTFPGVKELVGHLRSIGANSPTARIAGPAIRNRRRLPRPFAVTYEVIRGVA